MNKRITRTTFAACVAAMFVAVMFACGGGEDPAADGKNTPPSGDRCSRPNAGCACNEPGKSADCGKVEVKVGSFVTCSMGKTTCDGVRWSECIGDTVVAQSFQGGGLRMAALGTSTACIDNPCDPYCNNFIDTPDGINDDSGLSASDAGLTIPAPSGSGACTCNQPSAPASVYTNILAANKGNPAVCSGNDAGTATDNCNHDYRCVGGTCQPYPIAAVNPSCGGGPDYTLGLGCHDGTNWQLQVCNRGYVPSPGLGNLVVAIGSGAPSTAPGACVTGASGASWPVGPLVTASPDRGKCVIDLASTSIGPGQCVNVNVGTQCTQLDGVTPLVLSSAQHWAAINPSTALLAGATPLPECDTCNNYTSFEQNAIPPLLGNAAACANSTCGTVCGAASDAGVEGGAGCHTYVTGTVYDPGGNIPLPGIAVYQPNVALTPFPAGVSCDTCASVLPPPANLVSSTFSDIDGTFALEVNATTNVPVVFQTGRWRRKITIGVDTPPLTACAVNNITVPADCYLPGTALLPNHWPATNCKTRLPQTSSEGDIPLTAIVTGDKEPFQCSIAKFMGGGQEIGVGGGKRMQLYEDTGTSTWDNVTTNSGTTASVSFAPARASGIGAGVTAQAGATSTISYLHAPSSQTRSGTGWKISAPVAGFQTITVLSGITPAYAPNGTITLSGSAIPANNGTWTIAQYLSANSVRIPAIAGGAADSSGGATRKWRVGYGGVLSAAFNGGTITVGGLTNAGNNKTSTIVSAGVPNAWTLTATNATGVANDGKNGQASVTWSAVGPGAVTVTGLSGMNSPTPASHVGHAIVFSGAANAGNNGTFTIASVVNDTTITIANPSAVVEAGPFAWVETISSASVALPSVSTLWSSQGNLNAYDEAILPCGASGSQVATLGSTVASAVNQGYFYNFMRAGGRTFANHWSGRGLLIPTTSAGYAVAPWNATATFQTPSIQTSPGNTMSGRVAPGGSPTTPHARFTTWLTSQGAYGGGGVNTPDPVSGEALVPHPTQSFEWLRGSANTPGSGTASDSWGTTPGGNYSLVYSFDTNNAGIVPTLVDGGAGPGCGRTILSDMHVDTSRGSNTGAFPTTCNLAAPLSPNEAAFEYLFFVLSSCAIGGAPIIASAPPPPPAPAALTPVTFTREYHAVCPVGSRVVWQAFSWQAAIPTGTSIVFQAQTAKDNNGVPGVYGVTVPVGTASTSTGPSFFTPPTTVDQDLTGAAPPQRSEDWLRIKMTFNPLGPASPVLTAWKQVYDCIPSE